MVLTPLLHLLKTYLAEFYSTLTKLNRFSNEKKTKQNHSQQKLISYTNTTFHQICLAIKTFYVLRTIEPLVAHTYKLTLGFGSHIQSTQFKSVS